MRNYTVRAFRAIGDGRAGAEIDVDFVLHGSAATAPPARPRAGPSRAEPGESVVIIDEGLAFNPERGIDRVVLVADETGLPGRRRRLRVAARRMHAVLADHRGAVAPTTPSTFAHPAGRRGPVDRARPRATSPARRRWPTRRARGRSRLPDAAVPCVHRRASSRSRPRPAATSSPSAACRRTASASAATGASAPPRPRRSRRPLREEAHS